MEKTLCFTARYVGILAFIQATLAFTSWPANAQQSGVELQAHCDNAEMMNRGGVVGSSTAISAGQCFSFVEGLSSGLYLGALLSESGRSYCPPRDFSPIDAISVIQHFFREYPELTGEAAGILAADALVTEFPCGGKSDNRLSALRRQINPATAMNAE